MFPFRTKEDVDRNLKDYYENLKNAKEAQFTSEILELKAQLMLQSAEDWKKFEHDFHSGMEKRKVELAKLDAEIAYKKELLDNMLKVEYSPT